MILFFVASQEWKTAIVELQLRLKTCRPHVTRLPSGFTRMPKTRTCHLESYTFIYVRYDNIGWHAGVTMEHHGPNMIRVLMHDAECPVVNTETDDIAIRF